MDTLAHARIVTNVRMLTQTGRPRQTQAQKAHKHTHADFSDGKTYLHTRSEAHTDEVDAAGFTHMWE